MLYQTPHYDTTQIYIPIYHRYIPFYFYYRFGTFLLVTVRRGVGMGRGWAVVVVESEGKGGG